MKYCTYCKKVCTDEAKFCPACGMALSEQTVQQTPSPQKQDAICITALVLGVISIPAAWVGFGLLFGIAGIVVALIAKQRDAVKWNPRSQNADFAKIGLFCAVGGTILSLFWLAILFAGIFVLLAALFALV